MKLSFLLKLLSLQSTDIGVEHCRIEPTLWLVEENAGLPATSVGSGLGNTDFAANWMHTGLEVMEQHHAELVQIAETMHQPLEMEDYGLNDQHDHYDNHDAFDSHHSFGGMCHDW